MTPPTNRPFLLSAAALVFLAGALRGQTPAASSPATEPAVALDPFEVKADPDNSYGALSSRSITAFNVALDHLPVSADIFDQAFMNDVAATTVEGLLSYSAGAGTIGFAGNPAAQGQPFDQKNQTYIQLRGMMTPNMQRDSLLFMGTLGTPGGTGLGMTSNFDLDRVEVIFGPQALLYDGGGAGGVVNVVSKQAHFGQSAVVSDQFRMDQYGTKYNVVDIGSGTDRLAVRVAVVNAVEDTRRVNIGDTLSGVYAQIAAKLGKTTIRASVEQTLDDWYASDNVSVNAVGDPKYSQQNGDDLTYLLATGQAGAFVNGTLNWGDVSSLRGDTFKRYTLQEFAEIEADTQWTDWLSTQISTGLSDFTNVQDQYSGTVTFYSPGATSNVDPGNWAFGVSSNFGENAVFRVFHGKALRGSALFTHDLFGGKAKSKTDVGADYIGNKGSLHPYGYFLADSNWNIVTNPSSTANQGRTILPAIAWTVNGGPVYHPLFNIGSSRLVYNGQNYVLAILNPLSPALVSPTNPEGTTIPGGAADQRPVDINEGAYLTNYTQWLNDRLDTMFGVRLEHQYTYVANQGGSPNYMELTENHSFNFEAGADYHLLPWLAPYFSVSNSYLVPPSQGVNPYNVPFPTSECLGGELGVKVNNAAGNVSGSLAYYHNQARNEEFQLTAALLNDISPSGLNGRPNPSTGFVSNGESDGLQLTLTANPTSHWRMRLSAQYANGRIQSSQDYPQLYNDQFHENSTGQVTYADGSVVYVGATFNSKAPAYTAANAPAGAVPLTVAAMSTPGNLYYANPNLTTGQINTGSDAAKVLTTVDPTHGAILTGVNGLPISALQLVGSSIPGLSLPGSIPVAAPGEHTWGYPRLSASFTNVYQFSNGWLKGFEAGGTVQLAWKAIAFYYYPNGLGTNGNFTSQPFYQPTTVLFNPLFGYTHKFGRVTFLSHLNIQNAFNHYHVIIYPDSITGWTNAANLAAAFDQQPRNYVWTNTVKF